ncbi:MAG: hypothetical protein Kow00121_67400 [Elainellaceae cyanobacterium]
MNPSRSPDASLYELATQSNSQSQPLQISPTTFKSLIEVLVDLLTEHQLPATIWLKLPRGEVWQAEFNRLCQSIHASSKVYALQTYQTNSGQANAIPINSGSIHSDQTGANDQLLEQALTADPMLPEGEHGAIDAVSQLPDELAVEQFEEETAVEISQTALTAPLGRPQIYTLPLSPDSQLKREYFVLVASPEFYGLVLAHRPRSVRSRFEANPQEGATSNHKSHQAVEESLEQKHPLLGLCSFEPPILRQVLAGVNQAICFGQPATASNSDLAEILVGWDDLVEQGTVTNLNPLIVGQLVAKQAQRQEEVWRSGAVYRRQAEQGTVIHQENEALLTALRTKDEFVKTMGQELRTPLTNMKTALSLLNSPHLKPQQRQRYMEMLSRECDRQSSLISSVLDLVQIESAVEQTPMEALRLSELVPGVVSTYQPLAQEKGLMLGYMIPEDLPPVSCTNAWLKQIVINLLHNSIKFTPTGGQVWVRARTQGSNIHMEFRDTGIGIPQAELPKIFDRFYRGRGTGEDSSGAGLGLSIVQQLLLRCGGSITVKSKPGEGSVFSVLLPIYNQDIAAKADERLGRVRE